MNSIYEDAEVRSRMLRITALCSEFCNLLENARQMEKPDFIAETLDCLPRIYWEFSDFNPEVDGIEPDFGYYPSYVDEDFYESVRRNVETLLGPDDVFLETFEEDMKYSDTPIAASVAESLADIFQPLYNFISVVKESEGSQSIGAYRECRENFVSYWSQTLCNVMRALNHLRFNPSEL